MAGDQIPAEVFEFFLYVSHIGLRLTHSPNQ